MMATRIAKRILRNALAGFTAALLFACACAESADAPPMTAAESRNLVF